MSPTPHSPRNALGSGLVWVSPASAFVTSSCCGGLPSNRGGRKRHRYPRSAQCGDVLSTLVQYEIAYDILFLIYTVYIYIFRISPVTFELYSKSESCGTEYSEVAVQDHMSVRMRHTAYPPDRQTDVCFSKQTNVLP